MSKYKIYIGKLSKNAKSSDLEDEFSKYGKVARVDLKSGYGFVPKEYHDKKDADEAVERMNDKEFDGAKIAVEWAKEDSRSKLKGPNTKDVCYNCGKRGHWNRCYRCGDRGHVKSDCPRSRTVSPASPLRKRNSRRSRSRSRSRDRHHSKRKYRDHSRSRSRDRDRRRKHKSRSRSRSRSNKKSNGHRDRDNKKRDKKSRDKSRSASKSRSKSKSKSKSKSPSKDNKKRRDRSSSSD